jgi:hypothetical protein
VLAPSDVARTTSNEDREASVDSKRPERTPSNPIKAAAMAGNVNITAEKSLRNLSSGSSEKSTAATYISAKLAEAAIAARAIEPGGSSKKRTRMLMLAATSPVLSGSKREDTVGQDGVLAGSTDSLRYQSASTSSVLRIYVQYSVGLRMCPPVHK